MRSTIGIISLLLLAIGALFLNETIPDTGLPQGRFTAYIDDSLVEALDEAGEVKVFISIRTVSVPNSTWSVDHIQRDHDERQARILAALDESDFTLTRLHERGDALSGLITKSGLEKLRHHPYVLGIDRMGQITVQEG